MLKLQAIFMLAALSFFSCKLFERKPLPVPSNFDWQGHRGCRGLMPENTVEAFLHALDFPEVQTLELDLAVSKDNRLIVSHEPFFNPKICLQPDGSRIDSADETKFRIFALTAEEIRGFDCGSIGNPRFPQQQKLKTFKPTLEEVVAAVSKKRKPIRWNIEIKSRPDWDGWAHPPVEKFVELVVAELRKMGIAHDCTVQSFDTRALEAMHRQAPDIQLAYLVENRDDFNTNLAKLSFVPAIFSPYYLTVDKRLVRQCKERHMRLVPWTVNDAPSMRRLIRLGVNGIITDYPNLILEAAAK